MTRVLVCGGRHYADEEHVFSVLDSYHRDCNFIMLIHGGASGADRAAARWASIGQTPVRCFPADWKTHGRAVGPIRNRQMIEQGKPDLVIAFPGGRGTADMVAAAREAGIEVIEVKP